MDPKRDYGHHPPVSQSNLSGSHFSYTSLLRTSHIGPSPRAKELGKAAASFHTDQGPHTVQLGVSATRIVCISSQCFLPLKILVKEGVKNTFFLSILKYFLSI